MQCQVFLDSFTSLGRDELFAHSLGLMIDRLRMQDRPFLVLLRKTTWEELDPVYNKPCQKQISLGIKINNALFPARLLSKFGLHLTEFDQIAGSL